jgi:leucyl-tRNA synthetase
VKNYIKNISPQSEIERKKDVKTGVFTGSFAINPINNNKIPIWIADYVLMEYGTGAVMGVPAHDKRDLLFATKHDLKVEFVLDENIKDYKQSKMIIGEYKGKYVEEVRDNIIKDIKGAKHKTEYKLRDWSISRERFWGAPIPIIYCDQCGEVPVKESDLPVILPDDITNYKPTGVAPLTKSDQFMNTKCPNCNGDAKREAKTMDTFVDSSWYYLRYIDPYNKNEFGNKDSLNKWMPVDLYIGGSEHAVGHLLYSRFITKFLYDEGYLNFSEPFEQLKHVGLIYGEDKRKMSKRWGNVITAKFVLDEYGADVTRLYEMFMEPFEQYAFWNTNAIIGVKRFINRVWKLQYIISEKEHPEETIATNKLIQKVDEYIKKGKYNLSVSEYMKYMNKIEELGSITKENFEKFLITLSPYAPFISEELFSILGHNESIHLSSWPQVQNNSIKETHITLPVQINGKLRGTIYIEIDSNEKTVLEKINKDDKLSQKIDLENIKKVIYVKNKIINILN